MRTRLLVWGWTVCLLGCGNSVVVDTGYTRTCIADADCTPAYFGDVCVDQDYCFPCANDVINADGAGAYNADRDAAAQACGLAPPSSCTGFKCIGEDGVCVDGTCELIEGEEYAY